MPEDEFWSHHWTFRCAAARSRQPLLGTPRLTDVAINAALPWLWMDYQRYGKQPRPAFPTDALMEKFNTRWVGPRTVTRK